ncbi:MAG: homoserine dehydrogenase [Alphaproteobacteria bacterium]|nr:homoserine dehydrogenase [Alphaproteobacteria bacterium]
MSSPMRIGIAGLGTVGIGVVKLIRKHARDLERRSGRKVEIVAVSARNRKKVRGIVLSGYEWVKDPLDLVNNPDIDVIVELIGGSEGVARDLVTAALMAGKHVVTANKALLAHHGHELALLADKQKVSLCFEAAVAGGIPAIKALREGFAANDIQAVRGILNGTCNYILTNMRESGRDFRDVLKEAQAKGYAEANPAFDVDGIDAAHKLALLTALAFGIKPDMDSLETTGIRHITASDIAHATELGYRIKLLGLCRREGTRLIQSVEPCLVPEQSALGGVEGVLNAVQVRGDFVGQGWLVGRGAGEGPTASAVVADLIDIARGHRVPVFGIPARQMKVGNFASTDILEGHFYMHVVVRDQPGVLAQIAAILRDHKVSVEAVLQRGRDPGKPVSIVMTTHKVKQADMRRAASKISGLSLVKGKPCLMRIEQD